MTKIETLRTHDFIVGDRDPKVIPEFPGKYMVADRLVPDGYVIVGDDLDELIAEAYEYLFWENES
jgi:hypothetical protein